MNARYFCFVAIVSALMTVSCESSHKDDFVMDSLPHFEASFIQSYLFRDWDDERWDKEMSALKQAGFEYLLFTNCLETDINGVSVMNYAPSAVSSSKKFDCLSKCLKSAQKSGIKVFVGLNFHELWWSFSWSKEWLIGQMEIANRIADELISFYKESYPDAFYGWYWVWEIDNLNHNTKEKWDVLVDALNVNLDYLHEIAPGMPVMMSPFMNYRVGYDAEEYGQMWSYIFSHAHFRQGDIFCPQDCIGAGGLTLDNERKWMKSLKSACSVNDNIEFWVNVETFDTWYCSASMERVKAQLEIANQYAEHIVSFAYCHYFSPNQVIPDFDIAYRYYMMTGKMQDIIAPEPLKNVCKKVTERGVEIYASPGDTDRTVGFSIYKDGILLARVQFRSHDANGHYIDKNGNVSNEYCLRSYNVNGLESVECCLIN